MWTTDTMLKSIFKSIKNNLPLIPFAIVAGLLLFPIWSHLDQEGEIDTLEQENQNIGEDLERLKIGDGFLVGASTLFAQNASVQLNLEVLGTYASTSGNLSFNGEVMPDGATCGVDEILKRTGANNWDCAADSSSSITSNSLNFDELQNPLVLDTNILITSASFNIGWGATSFINVGSVSFAKYIDIGVAGVRLSGDGDGAITFLGTGNGSDENLVLNLDDTANTAVWSTGTGVTGWEMIGSSANASFRFLMGGDGIIAFADAGQLTLTGRGTGQDEDLTIDLDTQANEINFSSSTGVTLLDFAFSASISSNFEAVGYASASAFLGAAFNLNAVGDCNDDGEAIGWTTTGLFTCNTLADADIPDAITLTGGTIGSNNISGTLTTTGTLTIGDNGDAIVIDASNWDITSAGLANFSAVVSHSFGGSLEPATNGLGSLGTNAKKWSSMVANTINAALKFFLPTYTGRSLPDNNSLAIHTGSGSLDFNDGTSTRVLDGRSCYDFEVGAPTAANPSYVGRKIFDNPFTIESVQSVASGSNAASWNLVYYSPGGAVTNVFTKSKSASTSSSPRYTTSNYIVNANVGNGAVLSVAITSRSATLEAFGVNVCGRYVH